MNVADSQDIGVDIDCPFIWANDFLSEPENFPKWASGLVASLRRDGDGWTAETTDGPMRVEFTSRNAFGVLDHRVTAPGQEPIDIPLRVIRNGEGCHVSLTLFRFPGMTMERFTVDANWVRRDLNRLKTVLEESALLKRSGNMK